MQTVNVFEYDENDPYQIQIWENIANLKILIDNASLGDLNLPSESINHWYIYVNFFLELGCQIYIKLKYDLN